jgi:uncharacterized membrane protein
MTDHHTVSARRNPQLVPRRLLRGKGAHHPVVIEEAERRNRDFQARLADRITAFAGSMNFVWFHAAIFAVWMLGQNRQSEFQQAKADHDFEAQELELKTNTQLTRQIHVLTVELHRRLLDQAASDSPGPIAATSDGDAPPAQGTVGRGRSS